MPLAEQLDGRLLATGWRVTEKMERPDGIGRTGSNFSIGYSVQRNGTTGFMKVLDLSRAYESSDPATLIQELVVAFNYERDLVNKCKRMSNVVTALDEGVERNTRNYNDFAQYIIFEFADSDLRHKIQFSENFDIAVEMKTLHNIAKGISQLHRNNITHQDIKPSNVLIFNNNEAKLGDLGRSSEFGVNGPNDIYAFAGDPTYAPPECLYRYAPQDWKERKLASDLYQLGGLIVFMYAKYRQYIPPKFIY